MVRCAIWYHLCNLKNVKNTHGGVLILVKLQAEASYDDKTGCKWVKHFQRWQNWSCLAHSCHVSHKVFLLFTYFIPIFHLYNPLKKSETRGFLTFSGGIEMNHWRENGLRNMVLFCHVTLQFVKKVTNFHSIFWTKIFCCILDCEEMDRTENTFVISVLSSFSYRSFSTSLHVPNNQNSIQKFIKLYSQYETSNLFFSQHKHKFCSWN